MIDKISRTTVIAIMLLCFFEISTALADPMIVNGTITNNTYYSMKLQQINPYLARCLVKSPDQVIQPWGGKTTFQYDESKCLNEAKAASGAFLYFFVYTSDGNGVGQGCNFPFYPYYNDQACWNNNNSGIPIGNLVNCTSIAGISVDNSCQINFVMR